jgi:hypothetical protein
MDVRRWCSTSERTWSEVEALTYRVVWEEVGRGWRVHRDTSQASSESVGPLHESADQADAYLENLLEDFAVHPEDFAPTQPERPRIPRPRRPVYILSARWGVALAVCLVALAYWGVQ